MHANKIIINVMDCTKISNLLLLQKPSRGLTPPKITRPFLSANVDRARKYNVRLQTDLITKGQEKPIEIFREGLGNNHKTDAEKICTYINRTTKRFNSQDYSPLSPADLGIETEDIPFIDRPLTISDGYSASTNEVQGYTSKKVSQGYPCMMSFDMHGLRATTFTKKTMVQNTQNMMYERKISDTLYQLVEEDDIKRKVVLDEKYSGAVSYKPQKNMTNADNNTQEKDEERRIKKIPSKNTLLHKNQVSSVCI